MKELTTILITTSIAIVAWIGFEVWETTYTNYVPDKLLEIATPLDGRIDKDLLKELNASSKQ
ncbi:MAG: hypothetical protein ACOZAO_01705 [Patescibacteria group bacterium]